MKKAMTGGSIGRNAKIVVSLVCVAVAFLSSCAQTGSQSELAIDASNPYKAEFERNYQEAKSSLVKGILRDGVISDMEMNEFADVFAQCMADHGLQWSWNRQDNESLSAPEGLDLTSEQVSVSTEQCYEKTDYFSIKPLFDFISGNPNNLNADEWNKQVLKCMKSYGIIDQDLDPDYFLTFYATPDGHGKPEFKKYLSPLEDEHDPNYDQAKSEKYFQCMQDPLGLKQ